MLMVETHQLGRAHDIPLIANAYCQGRIQGFTKGGGLGF